MPNSFYNHSTYPSPNAPGSSAALRSELDLITAGFDLLPTLSGNGYKVAMVNAAGTALIASSALQSLAITSSTINSTPIGGTTAAAGAFTTLSASGAANLGSSVTIAGGAINGTTIGATTASTGAFTTLSASGGITGNLTGNVTGNVTSAGTSSFTNATISGTPTNSSDVTNKSYVDTQDALKLSLTGGTMSGSIAMGANKITGVSDPTNSQDAATKSYVDTAVAGGGGGGSFLPLAGGTLTGNLGFNGTALRVTGDFSNATPASRLMVQTSTVNGQTLFGLIPNGTAVNAQFQAYNAADPNNASIAALVAANATVRVVSGNTGTGTLLPIAFIMSATEIARFTTTGNFLINSATDDGVNKLQLTGSARVQAAATQDAVIIEGRTGGTSSYSVTLTPTTLTGNRTLTLPDSSGTLLTDTSVPPAINLFLLTQGVI